MRGGKIFETFVLLLGRTSSYESMKKLHRANRGEVVDIEANKLAFQNILKKESFRFHGFMLFALAGLHKGCRSQQFFSTTSAKFHGLSRNGMLVQSQLGYMMKPTMFDSMTKMAVEKARSKVR